MRVNVRIKEGERERIQAFEGVCIARSGGGLQESFTVRKISFGEGVERVFPVLSPMIESIEVKRRGAVRRAKLYYLRDRRGKSARIAERAMGARDEKDAEDEAASPLETRRRARPGLAPHDARAVKPATMPVMPSSRCGHPEGATAPSSARTPPAPRPASRTSGACGGWP